MLVSDTFISVSATTSASATASIQGTLLAHDGTLVKAAKITANFAAPVKSLQQGPSVTGLLQGSAVTASDGSFTVSRLAAGVYTICAQAAQARPMGDQWQCRFCASWDGSGDRDHGPGSHAGCQWSDQREFGTNDI